MPRWAKICLIICTINTILTPIYVFFAIDVYDTNVLSKKLISLENGILSIRSSLAELSL